jgi:hypothetical protein
MTGHARVKNISRISFTRGDPLAYARGLLFSLEFLLNHLFVFEKPLLHPQHVTNVANRL